MPQELKKPEIIHLAKETPKDAGVEVAPVQPESNGEMKVSEEEKETVIKEISAAESDVSNIVAITNAQQQARDEEKAIEKALEKDLKDIYVGLSPELQREFRQKGEETAKEINTLLHQAKIHIGKIIDLIKKWLALIPGVNTYFLEQEAKIRADELIKLKR